MTVPFHHPVAWLNRHVTNRLLGPIVWFLPSFGRIEPEPGDPPRPASERMV